MNVEDEILTLPGLKANALAAYEEALADKQDAERQILDELREHTYSFLIDKLGVDPGTAAAALGQARESTTNSAAALKHPSDPATNLCIVVTVDGLTFQGRFNHVKVLDKNMNRLENDVYTSRFQMLWRAPGGSVFEAADLACLGKLLKEHLR